MRIKSIKADKVTQIYSGRPGCMCGCNGKHYYSVRAKGLGYDVDRSDASVRRVVANMNRFIASGKADEISFETFGDNESYVVAESKDRVYVAYFNS